MSRTDPGLRHGERRPAGAFSPQSSTRRASATCLEGVPPMATTSVEERPTPFPPAPEPPVPPAQEVRLCLLGSWRLLPGGDGPVPPNGQRLLAMLALLGRQSRAHVAATLWPDIDDERASGRLRSLLWRLDRRVVEL